MKLRLPQALIIARREYITTVRRRAFLLTAIGMPAYFAFVMTMAIGGSSNEGRDVLKRFSSLGVVDSSGLFSGAPADIVTDFRGVDSPFGRGNQDAQSFRTAVQHYTSQEEAEKALRAGQVSQVLVIPADYLERGAVRRYSSSSNLFSNADRRPVSSWLVRGLLAGRADSLLARRASVPMADMEYYALNKSGEFELKDDRREVLDLMVPLMFAMTLSLCIVVGGQYLLQGVAEEKESRILESLLCLVSPDELLLGKMIGLGGAGLTLVAIWLSAGAFGLSAVALAVRPDIPVMLVLIAIAYFICGYTFYGSLMTGIGSLAGSAREAQQFSIAFTFSNFLPFIMMTMILAKPNGPLATILSLLPPTAATAMLLRLTAPGSDVPAWQVALSLALLLVTAWLTLRAMSKIFRIGLLLYGKTPTFPEILRWMRA
jgi:ABC-2 type transport system permease protein